MNLYLATLYDFLPAAIVKIILFLGQLLPYWKLIALVIVLIILFIYIRKKRKKEKEGKTNV